MIMQQRVCIISTPFIYKLELIILLFLKLLPWIFLLLFTAFSFLMKRCEVLSRVCSFLTVVYCGTMHALTSQLNLGKLYSGSVQYK